MAFVSDKYNLLFIHTVKTGGTSISEHLTDLHGASLKGDISKYQTSAIRFGIPEPFSRGLRPHAPLREVLNAVPEAEEYMSFCVVRNPWDRIFSYFNNIVRENDYRLHGNFDFKESIKTRASLILPQTYWYEEVDEVIRFENLEDEYLEILREMEVPEKEIRPLKKLNRSPTNHSNEYRKHYDERTKEIVYYYYRDEIETFGYEF